MKIGIYNEPRGGSLGGSEVSVAVLAEDLSADHSVTILHGREGLTREHLAEFSETQLEKVTLRYLAPSPGRRGAAWAAPLRNALDRADEKRVTGAYDVFISFNHEMPLFCAAPLGILMVLFPFSTPEQMEAAPVSGDSFLRRTRRALAREWHRRKSAATFASYHLKLANSDYTRGWTRRRWGFECEVCYPPVDLKHLASSGKKNSILSVGRFATLGHGKNHSELLHAFGNCRQRAESPWSYDSVGACGSSAADQELFRRAHSLARQVGAEVRANVPRCELRELYGQARIFWHAAGFGIDEETTPELAEHFGMTTVEAMAAGCVPVVIDRGGQREIVEHGINGFLWRRLEELEEYTVKLMCDPVLLQNMSRAALARAQVFSRERHLGRMRELLVSGNGRGSSAERSSPTGSAKNRKRRQLGSAIASVTEAVSRPLWSVAIPTYESDRKQLETALQSVFQQGLAPSEMEIVVVDDCSPTGVAEEVVRSFSSGNIRFYRTPRNLGLAGAWNECISRTRGHYIHLLHQDDFVLPGFYSALERGLASSPQVGAAFCRFAFVDVEGHTLSQERIEQDHSGVLSDWLERILRRQRIQTASIIVKRTVYEELGGFLPELSYALDWEMWRRIAIHYQFWYEPQVLACYRTGHRSTTSRLQIKAEDIDDVRRSIDLVQNYVPTEMGRGPAQRARENYAIRALEIGNLLLAAREPAGAFRQLLGALRCHPSPRVFVRGARLLAKLVLSALKVTRPAL